MQSSLIPERWILKTLTELALADDDFAHLDEVKGSNWGKMTGDKTLPNVLELPESLTK